MAFIPAGLKRPLDTAGVTSHLRPARCRAAAHGTYSKGAAARRTAEHDRGAWEVRVMRAFVSALQDPQLEPTSDFFAAGGDSLAAAAAAAELDVPPQLLAGFPTARGLAAHLAAAAGGATARRLPSCSRARRDPPQESLGQGYSGQRQRSASMAGNVATMAAGLQVPIARGLVAQGTHPTANTGALPQPSAAPAATRMPDPDQSSNRVIKGWPPAELRDRHGNQTSGQAAAELRAQRLVCGRQSSCSMVWRVPMADCVDAASELVIQRTLSGGAHAALAVAVDMFDLAAAALLAVLHVDRTY